METAILLFDGMTALDAIGPYEVLRSMPEANVKFVARARGPKRVDSGFLTLTADFALDEVTAPDIVLVPGTPRPGLLTREPAILEWLRAVHQTTKWTTSVCTGALALAAAGLLRDKRATTHWLTLDALRSYGAIPVSERVVREGKIVTAAGVSAGIDMALTLAALECGEPTAQQIQLVIEYDPQPPFDAGSPDKAPARLVEDVRGRFTGLLDT